MSYNVLVSKTFQRKFQQFPNKEQDRIRKALKELKEDPYKSRPNCDIKFLNDTKPKKHRLRIGDYRVIYYVEKNEVKIIDLIKRELGYSRLE
jgi:mRNA-degrading endonuclease RelE of RelBE toxin-antitoxin system